MPNLNIRHVGAFAVAPGVRLARAIEAAGVDIGHRCGGKARCTTCRVQFFEGEPEAMTAAEFAKLAERGLLGQCRLSCQIVVGEADLDLAVLMRVSEQGWEDPGPDLSPTVEPDPQTFPRDALR